MTFSEKITVAAWRLPCGRGKIQGGRDHPVCQLPQIVHHPKLYIPIKEGGKQVVHPVLGHGDLGGGGDVIPCHLVLERETSGIKLVEVEGGLPHPLKPVPLDDHAVPAGAGGEELGNILRGGLGTGVVCDPRTVPGREEVGKPLLVDGPDQLHRRVKVLPGGCPRDKNFDIFFFADMKQAHMTASRP